MLKSKRFWLVGLIGGLTTLMATPAFARSINFKDAGVVLWIFIIIGAVIVLLQLIPAIILFFSFVGTMTGLVVKKKASEKSPAEEKAILTGVERAPVGK
jgi:hypothetical protein